MEAFKAIPSAVLVLSTAFLTGCPSKDIESDAAFASHCQTENLRKDYMLRITFDKEGGDPKPTIVQSMTHDGPAGATFLTLCPGDKVTFFGPVDLTFKVVFGKASGSETPFEDLTLESERRRVCWDVKPTGRRCGNRQASVARMIRADAGAVNPVDPPPMYGYSLVGPCNAPECTWDPVIIVEK